MCRWPSARPPRQAWFLVRSSVYAVDPSNTHAIRSGSTPALISERRSSVPHTGALGAFAPVRLSPAQGAPGAGSTQQSSQQPSVAA